MLGQSIQTRFVNVSASELDRRIEDVVEHVFGYLLYQIRAERSALCLPTDFDFACLVHGHSVQWQIGLQFINAFTFGQPLLLPSDSPLAIVRDRDSLCDALLPLYARGEHDTSFADYSRPDASLLHIHNVHG